MSASVVLTYLRNMISTVYQQVTITMIMSLKEHENFVVSMIVLVIWYFSEERVEEIDSVDDSEFIQGKEEQSQSESENDGKEFDKHRIKI